MKLKRAISILLSLLLSVSFVCSAAAHSGRTDSSGGHKDNKNKSGLGSYHYHHGYGPHSHPGGVCPYSGGATTPASTSGGTPAVAADNSKYFVYSDIVATINDVKIPSLNYDNATYIKADDLAYYGFDVVFDSSAKTLTISRNSSKQVQGVDYVSGEKGTKASKIVDSSIEVYLKVGSESVKIGAHNSNDYMYIKFGGLSKYGTLAWDDVNRISALTLE